MQSLPPRHGDAPPPILAAALQRLVAEFPFLAPAPNGPQHVQRGGWTLRGAAPGMPWPVAVHATYPPVSERTGAGNALGVYGAAVNTTYDPVAPVEWDMYPCIDVAEGFKPVSMINATERKEWGWFGHDEQPVAAFLRKFVACYSAENVVDMTDGVEDADSSLSDAADVGL